MPASKEERIEQALDYYDRGVLSANPDEYYRAITQSHRWGHHGKPYNFCPVCARKLSQKTLGRRSTANGFKAGR